MEIENVGNPYEGYPRFLALRNRSSLPGSLPFPPNEKKISVPSLRKRLFAANQYYDGNRYKCSVWKYIEWFLVAAIIVGIVSTISIRYLRDKRVLGISLWKSEVFLLMLLGCRLASEVVVGVIVCVLNKIFGYSNGFRYVVYKVQHTVKRSVMAWTVLVAWEILYGELSRIVDTNVMTAIEKFLIVIGVFLSVWVAKSVMVMSLAAWFHMQTYHEKISESLFYRYVVEALMGLPLMEYRRYLPTETNEALSDLQKLNPKFLSSWDMKKMMIKNEEGIAIKIRTEDEAKREAEKMFQNVAKPSSQFIDLEDLNRFLPMDEALKTLKIFRTTYEDEENIQISLLSLQEWMVHSFRRYRCLLLSVKDTDASSKTIGTIFSIVVGIVLVAFSIPLLELGGVKYLMALSTNSFIITYLFGQIWEKHYYGMHLLYIRHPFDVGDEVEIEKIEMFVEKLKMTETLFVGRDKKKYTLSNFSLCDKLIVNKSRSEL